MSTVTTQDPHLDHFVTLLEEEHHCHTVILYGSRALGLQSANSDYDLLGIRTDGEDTRDARFIRGVFLDAFIRSEKPVAETPRDFLHIRGGVILLDPKGIAARLLLEVDAALQSPPIEVPAAEIEARRTWCTKTLGRIRNATPNDVEAHYRRHWLLVELLELYFVVRHQHYLGPKESFRRLEKNDPLAHRAFAEALAQGAGEGALDRLVHVVCQIDGPRVVPSSV